MRELFATLPDDPAPPMRDGYLDTVLTRGRRSARRRRIGTAAVWVLVVLALAVAAVPFTQPLTRPGAPTREPGLPDRFAGYSTLTSTVAKAPAGRAIALYTYGNGELFNMFQPLVVGADRDTYRRVDAMQERDLPSALLAPDGTLVLLGDNRGAISDLVLVDLGTGKRRSIPIDGPVGVRLLAWSPDGRYVAYSAATLTGSDGTVNFVDSEVARGGTLRLLDLTTGRSTELAAGKPAWTAAFAPDSRRLAVQVGRTVHLLDLDGRESGTIKIRDDRELVANVGWSPDGRFLATVPWRGDGPSSGNTDLGEFLSNAGSVSFIPVADDGGPQPPAPVDGVVQVLGWRSASSLVAATTNDVGHLFLTEVPLRDGPRRTLSSFDTGSTCELGMQTCRVADLRLATGLLSDATVRHARGPQRGPWPAALTTPIAAVVLGAGLLLWRRTRR
ncbi:hypothetical protein ABT297_38880 [Dactylosporangium sp. NPDC000555]|uniref:WD40 repeat domain-containing protein n=1 Tax=Dactylosporangium sp. NPDC000555 TaxID=3154260 RepID=UPI00332B37FA